MSEKKDMELPCTTDGAQFFTDYCCVLHATDASLYRCTRKHAFKDDYSLTAYAVFVQAEADAKRRKKAYRPPEHGA